MKKLTQIILYALVIIFLTVGAISMYALFQPQTPYMALMLQCGGTFSTASSPQSWHSTEDEAKAHADSQFNSTYNLAYIMRPQSQQNWTPLLWVKSTGSCYNGAFANWRQPDPR